ncbi:MAG: hypothetical protein WDM78_21275 [Puia sp.]
MENIIYNMVVRGTEIRGYGDGVYIADHPMGPFTYQASNPFFL